MVFYRMNKKLSLVISILFGILLIVGLAFYIGIDKIKAVFTFFSFKYLIFFLFISIFIMFLRVLKWKFILQSQHIKVPITKLFMYRIGGFAVSFLTPSAHVGGEPIRAYLLANHKIKFRKALSSVVVDKAIELTLNGFFTCAFLIVALIYFKLPLLIKLFSFFLLFLILTLIALFYYKTLAGEGFFSFIFTTLKLGKLKKVSKYKNYIKKLDSEVATLFYESKGYFGVVFLTHMTAWLFSLLEYQLVLLMLGYKVSIFTAFGIYAATGAAYTIPIPAALGILEFTQSIMTSLTKLNSQVGFVISFIIRGRDGIWALIGIAYLYYRRVNFIAQIISNGKNSKIVRKIRKISRKIVNKNNKLGKNHKLIK